MAFVMKNATLKPIGVIMETVLLVGSGMVMVFVILIATQKNLIMTEETVETIDGTTLLVNLKMSPYLQIKKV